MKITEIDIKADLYQEKIRNYELKYPWVKKTERYKNEVKFWSHIMKEPDLKFRMLSDHIAGKLLAMQKSGAQKRELSVAFESTANKSNYGNSTLKSMVHYLMKNPHLISNYSIADLHIKMHADKITGFDKKSVTEYLVDSVPKKYHEGVLELFYIQKKINMLS